MSARRNSRGQTRDVTLNVTTESVLLDEPPFIDSNGHPTPWRLWKVSVALEDDVEMPYMEKIIFGLHQDFGDVEVKKAPFCVEKRGWGGFPMKINLFFKERGLTMEPRSISHDLNFNRDRYVQPTQVRIKHASDELIQQLPLPAGFANTRRTDKRRESRSDREEESAKSGRSRDAKSDDNDDTEDGGGRPPEKKSRNMTASKTVGSSRRGSTGSSRRGSTKPRESSDDEQPRSASSKSRKSIDSRRMSNSDALPRRSPKSSSGRKSSKKDDSDSSSAGDLSRRRDKDRRRDEDRRSVSGSKRHNEDRKNSNKSETPKERRSSETGRRKKDDSGDEKRRSSSRRDRRYKSDSEDDSGVEAQWESAGKGGQKASIDSRRSSRLPESSASETEGRERKKRKRSARGSSSDDEHRRQRKPRRRRLGHWPIEDTEGVLKDVKGGRKVRDKKDKNKWVTVFGGEPHPPEVTRWLANKYMDDEDGPFYSDYEGKPFTRRDLWFLVMWLEQDTPIVEEVIETIERAAEKDPSIRTELTDENEFRFDVHTLPDWLVLDVWNMTKKAELLSTGEYNGYKRPYLLRSEQEATEERKRKWEERMRREAEEEKGAEESQERDGHRDGNESEEDTASRTGEWGEEERGEEESGDRRSGSGNTSRAPSRASSPDGSRVQSKSASRNSTPPSKPVSSCTGSTLSSPAHSPATETDLE